MRRPSFLMRLVRNERALHHLVDAEVVRISNMEVIDRRTALIGESASGPTTLVVSAVPAPDRARAFRRLMRVDRIDIEITGSCVKGRAHGVGHRLPTRRRVPLTVALGLVELGVEARAIVRDPDPRTVQMWG